MTKIFTVPGKPQGKARARTFYNHKIGRTQTMTPENTVLYENLVKTCYMQQTKGDGWFAKQPLTVMIKAGYPIPKSITKAERQAISDGLLSPVKKPDADNVAKVICDALNGVAYSDDTQVTDLRVVKVYAEEPYVEVSISENKICKSESSI